jgi:hypothetical protein
MTKQLRQAITPTHMLGSTGTDVGSNLGHCSLGALPALTSTSTVTATKLVPTGNVTAGNGMYLPAANTVAFSTNGSERVRILADGQISMGMLGATPKILFPFVDADSQTFIELNGRSSTSTTEALVFRYRKTSVGAIPADVFQIRSGGASAPNIIFSNTDAAPVLTLDMINSRVGIGTTTPNVSLEVAGNIHVSGGDRTIFNRSNNSLAFGTNNSERMRILAGGAIAVNTTTPNASALVDITSTTRGFLPPRMTGAQRDAISTPAAGLIVYNTTSNKINFYNGSAWRAVDDSAV